MPRFPVAFGKRKQAAHSEDSSKALSGETPSFRVLDRSELAGGKGPGDGVQRPGMPAMAPKSSLSMDSYGEDNIFADLKNSRGSGASNLTKTTGSTDNSSRHSNASTAPSSADLALHDDMRNGRKPFSDVPVPPVPKGSSGWSLKSSGRTFSFGGQKRQLPTVPSEPAEPEEDYVSRARSKTASTSTTSTTATPPALSGQDFDLDLGSDFSNMFKGSGFDKRASVMTLKQQQMAADDRQALAPRSLTGNRLNQPSPIQIDRTTRVEESPYSWNSQHSGDQLISASPVQSPTNENDPPPVPKHGTPLPPRTSKTATDGGLKRSSAVFGRRRSTDPAEGEGEDALLLKHSLAASKFIANPPPPPAPSSSGRYRRSEDTLGPSDRQVSTESRTSRLDQGNDDNLFDSSLAHSSRMAQRFINRKPSPPGNKVMTPAQFEKYRRDKERQDAVPDAKKADSDDEDEVNYDDDEDEVEKSRQIAKQRRKQEANMAVYRQQMMKVTGESHPRPNVSASMSTPNLTLSVTPPAPTGPSDNSDEDEEVPLAILAAHGFPNKNRPPNRLSTMTSNPNLRASVVGPGIQRPESAVEGSNHGAGGRLPPFARRLPQDPYGIVNSSVRESIHMGGGASAPGGGALPPGGLVGVIANEERTRAMRRGSPNIDGQGPMLNQRASKVGYDPLAGIPPQMMYPQQPMATPNDMQMNQQMQQMQQFMQMQMQFMNMMASQQAGPMAGGLRPNGHLGTNSMGDIQRRSFLDPGYESARGDAGMRTMSMVQPSSASFYGQPMGSGTPSIHVQGQYAPSIAPSERSNIGLPGRYRPVSHIPPPEPMHQRRASTMSGALGAPGLNSGSLTAPKPATKAASDDDDDDEKGWEKMKAKRERRKSLWKSKKSFGAELSALIS